MSESLAQRIGNRIKALRADKGWTQSQLAVKCGRSEDAISALERGGSTPNLNTLDRLAIAFDVRLVELLPSEAEGEADVLITELLAAARGLNQKTLKIAIAQIKALKAGS